MEETAHIEQEIAKIEAELSNLANRRNQLSADLTQLRQRLLHHNAPAQLSLSLQETSLTTQSPQEEKIQFFRSLFKGREDLFPRRFVNTKTGKIGK